LQNATVREVTRKDVVDLIRRQEYLGTLGSGRYYYALHFNYNGKEHLGGACIFGSVAEFVGKRAVEKAAAWKSPPAGLSPSA
jgi:hypothetical protein